MSKFKKIIIPKNIRKILEATFGQCQNLEEVILPQGLKYIGENAFFGCEKLKRIVIPKSVKKIDLGAFSLCSDNLEIYDQETNMRFINDINYNYSKDKSIDEIILDLCSKYDIVKEKLLFLARLRLFPKYYEKLNYEDEYNSFINYCKNNLFGSLEKANFESQKRINSNSINDQKKDLVPWYASYIPGFIIPMDAEADTLDNNVPRCISELVDEETLLLEKLGITKDKYGYWKDGDIIPELKVKEMKRLVKTNNYNKLS